MDTRSLVRAIRYLGHYRFQAFVPYLLLLVATLAQLMVPRMVGRILDAITRGAIANALVPRLAQIPAGLLEQILGQLNLTQEELVYHFENAQAILISSGVAILIFAVVRGFSAFLQTFTAERNAQRVAFDLRNQLFAKIQSLSFSYHDRTQTGQLMIRATDDVEKVRLFIGQGLLMSVGAIILLAGTLFIIGTTNFRLTLVALPILPVSLVLFGVFGAISGPLFTRIQMRLDRLNTVLQENLAGIRVIKAFTREKSEQQKFERAADDLMNQQIKVARVFTFLFPLVFLVANIGQGLILYFGGRQILSNTLTLGEWQEFSIYLVYVFLPMAQLGMIITQMSQAAASASRIFEILDAKSDVTDKPGASNLPPVNGQVRFEKVTFRYVGSSEPVLSGVDFEAQPGQTVALLGATGSGKSTIITLLPRFYDPSEGRITIDGIDLRDVTIESLRSQIGVVLQETTLFAGTIRENIAFGRTEASQREVESAARAAAAHDFITEFPDGYDTNVGERGATLSGGQRQRIAIARALLMNPRVLILDDSTSSVDLATEAQIQRALDELMKGRTSFVIAQRISTVMKADLILVLEKGRIVAQGRHAELLESSETYAEIYNSQLLSDVEPAGEIEPAATTAPGE
jgi:ATP-binding cassette subfamily B protein